MPNRALGEEFSLSNGKRVKVVLDVDNPCCKGCMFDNNANAEACMNALKEKYSCDSELKTIFGVR